MVNSGFRRAPRSWGLLGSNLDNKAGTIPVAALPDLLREAKRRQADLAISNRWNQLGGEPGPQIASGDGLKEISGGFYREYQKGRIYYRPGTVPIHVYGDICNRYVQLGGPGSWLGWPIFLHDPNEGDQLSKLDEQPFTEGGRVSSFENGAIYWWPDTGALELGQISLRYSGLVCFSDTSGPGSDEPYLIIGTVPAPPTAPSEVRTVIYEDVDGGESREDDIEIYRGLPYGVTVNITLMEHDLGDPNKYLATVKEAVDQAAKGAVALVGQIPYVGSYLAPVSAAFLAAVSPDIAKSINDGLGTDDDFVGTVSRAISAKELIKRAYSPEKNFKGILWDLDSPLISGDDADYKAYFVVKAI
jgi:hypothetical protein